MGLEMSRCTNAHAAMAKEAMMVALAKAPVTPESCQWPDQVEQGPLRKRPSLASGRALNGVELVTVLIQEAVRHPLHAHRGAGLVLGDHPS